MPHRIAPRTRADLDEIWRYIAVEGGGEAVADNVIDLVTERFRLLADWPRLGRARHDLRLGLRSFPVGNYLIFYRIARTGVVILRVLHGRRDVTRVLGG